MAKKKKDNGTESTNPKRKNEVCLTHGMPLDIKGRCPICEREKKEEKK